VLLSSGQNVLLGPQHVLIQFASGRSQGGFSLLSLNWGLKMRFSLED